MSNTKWQKQGMIILILSFIGMIISALFKNIYCELLFMSLFITIAISLRLNIEFYRGR